MHRLKLTSPGMLLILAIIAAGGIFLLDLFYLKPYAESQRVDVLREASARAEHTAGIMLQSSEENLLRSGAALAQDGEPTQWLKDPTSSDEIDAFLRRSLDAAGIESAWILTRREGRLHGWVRHADQAIRAFSPDQDDPLASAIRRLDGADTTRAAGMIRLPRGIAVFARHTIPDKENPAEPLGTLCLIRTVDSSTLDEIGSAIGGEFMLVCDPRPPRGVRVDESAPHALWSVNGDHLSTTWPAKDFAGKTLGYFSARVPIGHIHRQAAAARRTVLIVLSLSVGLATLVIVGAHMLITGPVVRLLRRLQEVESGEGSTGDLARDLHGEPLMLARRLESAFDRLTHISKTDELTGLSNRRNFEEVLDCFYLQARRYNRPLCLMVMDVDFFKTVNDTAGHQAGDEMLEKVARAVELACRKADLPARLGGDEFAVLLPETGAADASAVAERILRTVADITLFVKSVRLKVTISIGLTDLNVPEVDSPEAMTRIADRALYAAKELGRNRIVTAHDLNGTLSVETSRVKTLHRKFAGLDSEFRSLFLRAIRQIVRMLELRDPHMADHAWKVQHYAALIASEMGLPDRIVDRIRAAAMLHDVGMLALPDSVLLCPSPLDDDQVEIVRRHPLLSVRIMEGMEFLEQEIPAVRYHHERYDGTGYPEGISGAAIPLTARILSVADCLDAVTTSRTFRDAISLDEAVAELKRSAGSQFDPAVVDAFACLAERLGAKLLDVPGKADLASLDDLLSAPNLDSPAAETRPTESFPWAVPDKSTTPASAG